MGLKIAIGGKGGVGKTTVCAVWAELFAADGFDVLALDADPNTTLAQAFGLGPDKRPEALIEMKHLIAERTGTDKDSVGAYFRLNPQVSDLPEKYWVAADSKGVKLLVLGGITQAGGGCACPEGAFLKALLTYTMLQREEIVLVDLAAGVEFMGRASIQGIDALVVVVEPGARSIETANKIGRMGQELGARYVAAIVNKITEAGQIGRIEAQLTMPVLASIDYSPAVQEADLSGSRVFGSDEAVVERLRQAKDELVRVVSQE
ncbi:MAG: ATP-binding protein [Planctomycetota bacterium]|jgi:CO dehydrogenase maturation factor